MKPIIKWAGGKAQLLDRIVDRMPKEYGHYYEPFIGGGALLFKLATHSSTINDINKELIHLYNTIKDEKDAFVDELTRIDLQHEDGFKDFYLQKRVDYNNKIIDQVYDVEMAALFVYLNKHCFNGLYRVNSKGLFNVPFNNKKSGKSFELDNINEISKFFKSITILNGDFEDAVKDAKEGDFVFFDSPYDLISDTSFESYTKSGFPKEEHIRLANVFKELSDRGVYCMLTNHNTDLINELYLDFNIEVVEVRRMINSNANGRTGQEVIITNYQANNV